MTTRAPRRGSPRRSRRGPRPSVGWTNATVGETALGSGVTSNTDLLGAFTVGEKFNIGKILRVFGEVHFRGATANVNLAARFGLAIVSDDSLALSAVPDPLGDEAFGWYWNDALLWSEPSTEYKMKRVDTRTQRRLIGDASTLMFSLENPAGTAMDFMFAFRILYQKK